MAYDTEQQSAAAPNYASPPKERERTMGKYDYDAFLSYRRRDATQVAQWIRNKLQRFRLPV
jgi:hypothetical protein